MDEALANRIRRLDQRINAGAHAFDHREDAFAYHVHSLTPDLIADLLSVKYLHAPGCANRVCLNPEHEGEQPAIDVTAS